MIAAPTALLRGARIQQCLRRTFHGKGLVQLGRPAIRRATPSSSSNRSPAARAALQDGGEAGSQHDQQQQAEQQRQAQQTEEAEAEAEYSMQTLEAAAATRPPAREVSVAAPGPLSAAQRALRSSPAVTIAAYAAAGFLGLTFLITVVRLGLKFTSTEARRGRTINKNKLVVDEIGRYLPGNRAALTAAAMGRLRFQTGFGATEIFRKYLWFLLRERTFDQEAVDDLIALKAALGLGDDEVVDALRERAQRIYDKYGNVMLETEGMTKAGIERKATTRALFSKLQYLLDCEALLSPAAAEKVSLRDIFGATEQDVARLRIVSLHDVDLESVASLPTVEGKGEGRAAQGPGQE